MDNRLRIESFSLKEEREAWIFLNSIPELGPVRFHRLLHAVKSVKAILELSPKGLEAAGVPSVLANYWHQQFHDAARWRWIDAEQQRLAKANAGVVTELDPEYPDLLRELIDRPPVLYCKGRWPRENVSIGVVGTRRASAYALEVARRLATDLVAREITVTSGLALGVDASAHQAALKAGGFTIAVLGCGFGHRYPRENEKLYAAIAEAGLLLSEFSFETPPDARNFPRRNRIISGLSKGIVVVEAGLKSGALITARYAAEQGREVYGVPGSVLQSGNAGGHLLLKTGARLVESVDDILQELAGMRQTTAAVAGPSMTPPEEQIFGLLSDSPVSIEEIAVSSSQRFEEVARTLLELELKGVILNLPGQRYVKNYKNT